MTSKEVLLLQRFYATKGTSWDSVISDFCGQHLECAKTWARAQKIETIDELLEVTIPKESILEETIV